MIDTHAHLDVCADPPDVLMARARDAGVRRIVTVGTKPESWRAALALAEQHDGVYAALGVHPHEAGDGAAALDELRAALAHDRAVAVGETGLDYFHRHAEPVEQRALFDAQLALADELGKPVVVHTRAADADTAAALATFRGTVVLHCFSEPGLLPVALERRYYVSFAGNATYPKAVAVGETGLDYHHGAGVKPEQRRLFERQLALAEEAGKPVVIHCRMAAGDTASVLSGFRGTVVLHCFSEPDLYRAAADRGYYLSFAGNVTYPRSADLRTLAALVERDRVLAETDAPYLAPVPLRGRRNEPANVVHTLAALAAARDEDAGELERRIDDNASAAFGIAA